MKERYLLEEFEPQRVLRHFEDICSIPHVSGFETALGDHILALAKKKNYETYRDKTGNILIRVPATPGYEHVAPLLLQGHLDMVNAKDDGINIDLEKEPVQLVLEGNILRANGTTLGADTAVGLCNMMALLDADDLRHPPLELLFTIGEEVGLIGILQFDMGQLKARRMINMDCGDPDCMVIGAAGGAKFRVERACQSVPAQGAGLCIVIDGLQGGHSGLEAGKNRGSAIDFGGRLLSALCDEMPVMLAGLTSTGAESSLPKDLKIELAIPHGCVEKARDICKTHDRQFAKEIEGIEPDYCMKITECAVSTAASVEDTRALADFMLLVPYEVIRRSHLCADWKLCSALLALISYKDGLFSGFFTIRANRNEYRDATVARAAALCRMTGIALIPRADYIPAWPEKEVSPMRDLCVEVYKSCFGEDMVVEVEHGTVECGIIANAIPEMDIVGFAPKSRGAHTTKEHLFVDSMAPFWVYLTSLLDSMCA